MKKILCMISLLSCTVVVPGIAFANAPPPPPPPACTGAVINITPTSTAAAIAGSCASNNVTPGTSYYSGQLNCAVGTPTRFFCLINTMSVTDYVVPVAVPVDRLYIRRAG